jgi:hypothetical protein
MDARARDCCAPRISDPTKVSKKGGRGNGGKGYFDPTNRAADDRPG